MTATLFVYCTSLSMLIIADSGAAKFGWGFVYALAAGKFFVIGHDACHNSFTPNRRLNRLIGTVSLTLSYHVYSLWEEGHNRTHHNYTNLRARDFVWRPLSLQEYRALSPVRRALERFYRNRSGIGFLPYYLFEILLPRMAFPLAVNSTQVKRSRTDLIFFYALWITLLIALAMGDYIVKGQFALGASAINILVGFVFPLAYVCWAIGFVVFFNHTHPSIPWFESSDHWSYWEVQQHCTLHLRFSRMTEFLLPSEVMNHVVHHLNPRVPVRKLRRAQEEFNRLHPHSVKIAEWSPRVQADILDRCKLYDYVQNQWLDFDGNATSQPLARIESCHFIGGRSAAPASPEAAAASRTTQGMAVDLLYTDVT